MQKLYILFSVQFGLTVFHIVYFLRNLPDSLETKDMIYMGHQQLLIPVFIFVVALQNIKGRGPYSYRFLHAISIIYVLSMLVYGYIYALAETLNLIFVIFAVIYVTVNALIVWQLVQKETKIHFKYR